MNSKMGMMKDCVMIKDGKMMVAKKGNTMADDGSFVVDYEIFYHHNIIIQKYGRKELLLLKSAWIGSP